MLTYAKIKANRRKFIALTGLTPKEFQSVLPAFERAYARRYPLTKTRAGTVRQRKAGGGRKSVLHTPEQKLLFALVYLKAYPLPVLVGEVFDWSQSSANTWLHRLLPVLQQALKDLGVRPNATRNPLHATNVRRAKHATSLSVERNDAANARKTRRNETNCIADTSISTPTRMW